MLGPAYAPREPYPGLRSFYRHEVDIFFGRDDHIDEMIEKLAQSHFLCVTGPSGCGKSSLARTGLMNGLEAGFLQGRGSDWIFVDFRPGGDPLRALLDTFAEAITAEVNQVIEPGQPARDSNRKAEVERLLSNHFARGAHNLTEAISIVEGIENRPILILIDQFEELFRYAQKDPHSAVAFVDVLLRTAKAAGNIYVVITIRTDELERCSKYPGLTAAINNSQFLTPTLDRFEIQEAIEGPIAVFGGRIDPDFTIWLLNSIEDEPDKLPLLQHVMKILYRYKSTVSSASDAGSTSAYEEESSTPLDANAQIVIDLADFLKVFAVADVNSTDSDNRIILRKSLSNRLDGIYESFPPHLRKSVEAIFCSLTETESGRSDIRRPRSIAQLANITGLSKQQTREIVKEFAREEETYLNLRPHSDPNDDVVDVPHECVLRLWGNLQERWLPTESLSADHLRFLATCARNYRDSTEGRSLLRQFQSDHLLRGSNLKFYKEWFDRTTPTPEWAQRYLKSMPWPAGSASAQYASEKSDTEKSDLIFRWIKRLLAASLGREQLIEKTKVASFVAAMAALGVIGIFSQLKIHAQQDEIARLSGANRELSGLYAAARPADTDPENPQGFSGRLRTQISGKWDVREFSPAAAVPICPPDRFYRMMNDLTGSAETACGSYPKITEQTKATVGISAAVDSSYVQAGIDLGDTGQKRESRALLFTLANKYPNNPRIFRNLGLSYQEDPKIAPARQFSEAGACFVRALALSCRTDDSDYQSLDFDAFGFSDFLLKANLKKDSLRVLTALSASYLTDKVFAWADSEQPERAIDPLWRGAEAAAASAGILSGQFNCAVQPADAEACATVAVWYERAAKAWARMLAIAAAKGESLSKDSRVQVNYGTGMLALYWSETPLFRNIARRSIDAASIIAELEKAASDRKGRRYFSGLAMMYCLEKDFHNATQYAQVLKLTATEKKYQEIGDKASGCATGSNLEDLFTTSEISK